jgi:L-threonylcarbamoyladenylate synthase
MRRVFVDPEAPQRDAILEAAKWIRLGRVVAIPTDTLYGLAVNPFDAAAVARLFEAKGRPAGRALPLIAADRDQIITQLGRLSPDSERLADQFWPGPLTILMRAPHAIVPAVTAGSGKVGVRVPAHDVARAICRAAGFPLTATSANVSGQPETADPGEVEHALGDVIDLLVDTGRTPGHVPSTIVDASEGAPQLLRAGAIPWERIQECLGRL